MVKKSLSIFALFLLIRCLAAQISVAKSAPQGFDSVRADIKTE